MNIPRIGPKFAATAFFRVSCLVDLLAAAFYPLPYESFPIFQIDPY